MSARKSVRNSARAAACEHFARILLAAQTPSFPVHALPPAGAERTRPGSRGRADACRGRAAGRARSVFPRGKQLTRARHVGIWHGAGGCADHGPHFAGCSNARTSVGTGQPLPEALAAGRQASLPDTHASSTVCQEAFGASGSGRDEGTWALVPTDSLLLYGWMYGNLNASRHP